MAQAADSVTRGLKAWIEARFGEADVAVGSTEVDAGRAGIRLVLIGLGIDSSDRRATTLLLSYKITIETADPLELHRLASEVAFGLSELPLLVLEGGQGVPLDLKPVSDGEPPALVLTARLARARRVPAGPAVLKPMILEVSDVGAVEGMVATCEGSPISDALIEIPSLELRQRSRPDGSFRFSGLPGLGSFTVIARKSLAEARANARPGERLTLTLAVKD
ncbi:hypothetical protein [Aureimonas leprariae]|uniref:Carboxypeptidase regulatory-like domain-containing protein n=1 Tax=Plantimonas leprariae TaxID=2615207 RepID=A0A7V7PRI9_9HYPH|nr:hypothetical protein [Aureimonas leprariae]KAB0681331.1 hypothetical protein F6X38_05445 [Aureimonas leprariae]